MFLVQQALAVAGSDNVDLGDVSIRDEASIIGHYGDAAGEAPIDFAAVQQVTATANDGEDVSGLMSLAGRADTIEISYLHLSSLDNPL